MAKKITKTQLIKEGIKHVSVDGEVYFSVAEIKSKFAEIKIDTEKIENLSFKSYIKAENIEPYTEFDKKIQQALNFNPRKK